MLQVYGMFENCVHFSEYHSHEQNNNLAVWKPYEHINIREYSQSDTACHRFICIYESVQRNRNGIW